MEGSVTIKTLSMCAFSWFICLCSSWKLLICGAVNTNTRAIVYRLHDQSEDEERKFLVQ